MGLFIREDGGYTSVATAVALLVSVSLVFSVAAVEWTVARAADVQVMADAAAMAGSNVVGAYCSVAQALDACVLSMGLAGVAVLGASLVTAAVPGAQRASAKTFKAGSDILKARRKFAKSVAKGLRTIERGLPYVAIANAYACVEENESTGIEYAGAVLPLPLDSRSDFGSMDDPVDADELEQEAKDLRKATSEMEAAKKRADDAKERAWRADCVDEPSCLSSRAASLAGLGGLQNPTTNTPEEWDFGMPILRSRTYYAERLAIESADAGDIESVTDSCARHEFFRYALDEVNGAWYQEKPGGYVSVSLPHLARNSSEVRATWIYGDAVWPCSAEEEGTTLHSTSSCPGVTGELVGVASVADVDSGAVRLCPVCRMDVGDLGKVAAISTSATNGYEHYWQIIVEEAEKYEGARNEQADAEKRMKQAAEDGKDAFERVLDQLSAPRPKLCPPGAWGCIGVAIRKSGSTVPTELTRAFLSRSDVPAGAAVAASALAPDDAADGNDLLSTFFEGFARDSESAFGGVLDGVFGLWGRLMVSYGSAYEGAGSAVGSFLDRIDGVFGGTVGAWLQRKVKKTFDALGLEPADVRMRKPVLVSTEDVLRKAGYGGSGKVRSLVRSVASCESPRQFAAALGVWIWDEVRNRTVSIGELAIPGTDVRIPLSIDLSRVGEEV